MDAGRSRDGTTPQERRGRWWCVLASSGNLGDIRSKIGLSHKDNFGRLRFRVEVLKVQIWKETVLILFRAAYWRVYSRLFLDRLQAPKDLIIYHRHSPELRKVSRQVEFCASRNWMYVFATVHVCTRRPSCDPNYSALEPDQSHHDCLVACVIAQRYSSLPLSHCAFISARRAFKNLFFLNLFKTRVSPKLGNLKLLKYGSGW